MRLARHGPNALPEKPREPMWRRAVRQLQSPLIYILLFALAFDLLVWILEGAHGHPVESIAIALILMLNAGLGVFQEYRAEAAIARLKSLAAHKVWTLRDGKPVHIPSGEIVPGDVVRLEAGDRVPADGRLIESAGIIVDESILTGESIPVAKSINDPILSGSALVRGKAYAEVTSTGPQSNLGRLAGMLSQIEVSETPLERRLHAFGNQIARCVMLLALAIAVAGVSLEGFSEFKRILFFAVALGVAAVPEGLPAVLTLTLALGIERMSKRKAVIRRLIAVEALGSVTVIAADKTGTLTENRMRVHRLDAPDTERALRALVLANDAEPETGIGDPLDIALLEHARACAVNCVAVRQAHPIRFTQPFDSKYKYMRVSVEEGGKTVSYLKGAPEVVMDLSNLTPDERREWEQKAEAYANEGHRVLALGWREGEGHTGLTFLGLVMLWDPPRTEVPNAIKHAREAGIRVVMITGDHAATALAIARAIGIDSPRALTGQEIAALEASALRDAVRGVNVFARVAPEDKLKLVEALRADGQIVAMTGDGVNDAPALKRSDVGVSMGRRGSDVSREVADLVLLDDNFATIFAAIEEGRSIYENIQKFIRFLLSTNAALVMLVVVAAFGSVIYGLRDDAGALLLPLTAVQLLWINFIADGPPALALALDRNPGVMRLRPREANSPLLDPPSVRFIVISGAVKALVGLLLLILYPRLGYNVATTITVVFLYESLAQLAFAYPSRKLSVKPDVNWSLHAIILLAVGLQAGTVLIPGLRRLLGLTALDLTAGIVLVLSIFVTWVVAEATTHLRWIHGRPADQRFAS